MHRSSSCWWATASYVRQLEGQPIPGSSVRVLDGLTHDQMASGYAQLDVLVLPSHTTPTWKEQFGRVIIEALWCGVPGRRLGLGRDPLADRAHRRGADLPRGRSRCAHASADRAPRGARASQTSRGHRPSGGRATVLGARGDRPARAPAGARSRIASRALRSSATDAWRMLEPRRSRSTSVACSDLRDVAQTRIQRACSATIRSRPNASAA